MKRGFYTVTQLSKNTYIDNDGMLVCKNAVLGKAGTQAYVGYELGLDSSEIILLHRPEHEIFDAESLSSLRGKTLTLNHPDEDVTLDNYVDLAKGFVMNVWREGNLIIGDIKITDPEVIELVKDRKMVELSLGYDTKLVKSDDGKLNQTQIVYNHLALVKKGRAEVARIVDGHKMRVIDKQFEKGGNILEKETLLQRMLSAIGLRKEEHEGKEVFVLDANTVLEEQPSVTKQSETVEVSEDLTNVVTDQKPADITTVEDIEFPVENTEETETITVEEDKSKTVEPQEEITQKTVTDGKKEGEQMDKFDAILEKMKKIETITDADFQKTLKGSLLKELEAEQAPVVKVEDSSNDALKDFGKGTITDSDPVDAVDFDKEIKQLYDGLNPHNHETYENYIKFRKNLDRSARADVIQEEVDKAMGGLK